MPMPFHLPGKRVTFTWRPRRKALLRLSDNSVPRAQTQPLKAREVRNCLTDEGRPLGVGLQEQAPNHLRRLCPKGKVVNAEGKGLEYQVR